MTNMKLKKAEMKRESSPYNPYKRKAKGKETARSFFGKLSAPRARTCTRKSGRYRLAGAAAAEIVETCFGSRDDLAIWAKVIYDYPDAVEDILEKARTLASEWKQGERRFPVRSFQKWLGEKFPKKV